MSRAHFGQFSLVLFRILIQIDIFACFNFIISCFRHFSLFIFVLFTRKAHFLIWAQVCFPQRLLFRNFGKGCPTFLFFLNETVGEIARLSCWFKWCWFSPWFFSEHVLLLVGWSVFGVTNLVLSKVPLWFRNELLRLFWLHTEVFVWRSHER